MDRHPHERALRNAWCDRDDSWRDTSYDEELRFRAMLVEHPADLVSLIGSNPILSHDGFDAIVTTIASIRDELPEHQVGDALLAAIPQRTSRASAPMDVVLATSLGRRDLVDASIIAGMRLRMDDDDTPPAWVGRAIALGCPCRDAYCAASAAVVRTAAMTMSNNAVSGITMPYTAWSSVEGQLVSLADRCTDLGTATMAKAIACIHGSARSIWNRLDNTVIPDRLVITDWASMSADDQQMVIATALHTSMQRPTIAQAPPCAHLFLAHMASRSIPAAST